MKPDFLALAPVDVVTFRGNRLFAEAGHAAALMPPWPSVFAGALRSRMLVDAGVDFQAFMRGEIGDDALGRVLGSPDAPGSFRITAVGLYDESSARLWFPLPGDLLVRENEKSRELEPTAMQPVAASQLGCSTSSPLPRLPVAPGGRSKPCNDIWICGEGLARHLRGESVEAGHLCRARRLWRIEERVGIGMNRARRSAEEGLLYSTDTVCLTPNHAFLVAVSGADGQLPEGGLVRLGADGRAAEISRLSDPPPVWREILAPQTGEHGFRLILATPGLFPGGWLPPGVTRRGDDLAIDRPGLRARLVCASVGRSGVVSGWDLARRCPKPAERIVASGSTYWFECDQAEQERLTELVREGLWCWLDAAYRERWAARRAEGFNHVWIGRW